MKHIIFICSLISVLALFSCGGGSGSGATGFSIVPSSLTAPSPAAVPCSSDFKIGSVDSNSTDFKQFAVVYHSTTQTGIACGVYYYPSTPTNQTGMEIAKIIIYNDSTLALPTVGNKVDYITTDTTKSGVVVKYTAIGGNPASTPQKTALWKKSVTGNISFSITCVAENNYTVSSISFPVPTGLTTLTLSSITQAATAQ
jgi:hypothetical protein